MLRLLLLPLTTIALTGCSPDMYERWADRQVNDLVKDREQTTIGYQPQVVAESTAFDVPTKAAYDAVPVTRIPQDAPEPLVSALATVSYVPLGPTLEDAAIDRTLQPSDAIARTRRFTSDNLQLGPPARIGTRLTFGLFDSVAYAAENSREYQTRMEDLYLSALSVTLQRHLFTPRPFANIGAEYTGGQASVDYRSAMTVTTEAGVRQQLPYGGNVTASVLVDFVQGLSGNVVDGENATAALTASIPLLRGAGLVNLDNLISSERELIYAIRSFETYRRDFAVRVVSSYLSLVVQQQRIRNRYLRYLSSVDLLARTEALFAAGRINILQVQRAQEQLLTSEDQISRQLESYENQLDNFKLQLGMPVTQELEVTPVQVDVPIPEITPAEVVRTALSYRLDLQTSRDRVEDARRRVQNAQNGLLPDLDLTLDTRLRNPDGDPAKDLDPDTLTYAAGVRLGLPIDRLPERNIYRQNLISLERAMRNVEETEDGVLADVRAATRGIRSAQVTLKIQEAQIDLNRNRLEYANEALVSGRTTDSREVTDAQNALLSAQDQYEQARVDLQVQVLQYLRQTGTLRLDVNSGLLGIAMSRKLDRTPLDPREISSRQIGGALGQSPAETLTDTN